MTHFYLKDGLSHAHVSHYNQYIDPKLALIIEALVANLSFQHGDLDRWLSALDKLAPKKADLSINEQGAVTDKGGDLKGEPALDTTQLSELLMQFGPWRKGPFELQDVFIDTEWRSNQKWDRVAQALDLNNKHIIDVGCGNGYYGYRMLDAGARSVLGVDPSLLFNFQYYAISRFINAPNLLILPITLDELTDQASQQLLPTFDICFSMGVLYHRRSPFDHLMQLKHCLLPGGELVLETLVVEGDEQTVFIPHDRYAGMRNVWFLPSVAALHCWLAKCGFIDIETIDVSLTTIEEQRKTPWMQSLSLEAFLKKKGQTIEGYDGPLRAVIKARRP